jgi:hypothetical protein
VSRLVAGDASRLSFARENGHPIASMPLEARPMIHVPRVQALASAALVATLLTFFTVTAPATAQTQATPSHDALTLGSWSFRPVVDLRVRGEYTRNPVDVGGAVYEGSAVLANGTNSESPAISSTQPAVANEYFVASRARLGVAVEHGNLSAVITLQDARNWGGDGTSMSATVLAGPGEPIPPVFAPWEAYVDLHTKTGRPVFLRVGRQAVRWGDGTLLGANDWSATGRSLDAARFGAQVGDVDVELLASILATPGQYVDPGTRTAAAGAGVELYGGDAVYHVTPLLHLEATGLVRIARQPMPVSMTPSDTYVAAARAFGDHRGFRYAAEGAYETGSVAQVGSLRNLAAFAVAGRASLETSLPWHVTFGSQGAYATGDQGASSGNLRRFDPILPDDHTSISPMGLWAWSNIIEGGGSIAVKPAAEVTFLASYRYAALAEGRDRWTSATLSPIGLAPENKSRELGHEIDGALTYIPWEALQVEAGYGIFLEGGAATAILQAAGREAGTAHWVYLSMRLRVP